MATGPVAVGAKAALSGGNVSITGGISSCEMKLMRARRLRRFRGLRDKWRRHKGKRVVLSREGDTDYRQDLSVTSG